MIDKKVNCNKSCDKEEKIEKIRKIIKEHYLRIMINPSINGLSLFNCVSEISVIIDEHPLDIG
jgi:hypothetical protein